MNTDSANTIWTVGHSTRSVEEFLQLLAAFGITQLVDVRHFPGSRKYPQFNRDAMSRWMPEAGVAYTHIEALGGRRKARPDSPNSAWRHPNFRGYADHMETPGFRKGLAQLANLGLTARTAFMCSEAVWWRCHRALIADWLKANGWTVLHILTARNAKEHPYTAPARVVDGRLRYDEEEPMPD